MVLATFVDIVVHIRFTMSVKLVKRGVRGPKRGLCGPQKRGSVLVIEQCGQSYLNCFAT